MNLQRDVPIGPLTTYRVGGSAALYAEIDSEDDLVAAVDLVRAESLPLLVVGKGSNLLVADAGFDGLAIMLGDGFADVVIDGTTVAAGGAAALPVVARRTAAAGLTGFEWAVGVPGSIGGAVRMNAGGHGSDMAANLTRVRVVDLASGDDGWVAAAALDLAYRHSSIGSAQVVVRAELALERGDSCAPRRPSRRSCAGAEPISRAARTRGPSSPTLRTTRPDASSTRPDAEDCATRPRSCPTSTPTSSSPTSAVAPTTCSP